MQQSLFELGVDPDADDAREMVQRKIAEAREGIIAAITEFLRLPTASYLKNLPIEKVVAAAEAVTGKTQDKASVATAVRGIED